MKLYEKLANSVVNGHQEPGEVIESFIAGFLASRDLAVKSVKEMNIVVDHTQAGDAVYTLDPRDWCLMEQLGEEEVE